MAIWCSEENLSVEEEFKKKFPEIKQDYSWEKKIGWNLELYNIDL